MNFTFEIKNEILGRGFQNACCQTAALAAFLRTSGSVASRGGLYGFEAVTENEGAAEYFINLLESVYGEDVMITGAQKDKLSGRDKLTFACMGENTQSVLEALGIVERDENGLRLIFELDKYLLENECCRRAFICGAFVGGGSCTLPKSGSGGKTGYHLEIVFSNYAVAGGFCELITEFGLFPKLIERKGSYVVYTKSADSIRAFLEIVNAPNCLKQLNTLIVDRDRTNNVNRVVNCRVGNTFKTIDASVRQIRAINAIRETVGFDALPEELKKTALARIERSENSLAELAKSLEISKSCLNHRLRKLVLIGENLSEGD